MARARNIKPGFFLNDQLGELSMAARLLFAGLWCLADREGRMEDKPKKIKAQVLPYDDCDVNLLLDDLWRTGFIVRYAVDGEQYIQIINFNKHQNPHKNENPSEIPPLSEEVPYKYGTSMVLVQEQYGNSTVQEQDQHSTTPADSLNLIPDSLISDSLIPDSTPIVPKGTADGFQSFWLAYPKKIGKGAAEKAWTKIRPSKVLLQAILLAISRQSASEQWRKNGGQFIPNPATWLNQRRWEDEPDKPPDRTGRAQKNSKYDQIYL